VIRGAMAGVLTWGAGRKGKEVEITKRKSSKFCGWEFLEIGLRPKKGRQILLAVPFLNF
jgi:hypothetical protein